MRKELLINKNWIFTGPDGEAHSVDLPHTWNNKDGQDGGNDYWRGTCVYLKTFPRPDFGADERVYLQFQGVNASAKVELNGQTVGTHDGGYSTFRWDVTDLLQGENQLTVHVDNSRNNRVYPQKADFTFYGGIYRDVDLIIVNKHHFDMDYFGGPGIKVSAKPVDNYTRGEVVVDTWRNCEEGQVHIAILDADGKEAASADMPSVKLDLPNVHLWDGVKAPYLYTAVATLTVDGKEVDQVSTRFGVRDFHVDPSQGFFLNGRSYPLHGVSRHQDWKGIGNAITREHHDTDMAMIREVGANTIRLAHYQHDQYFYDLCDQYGMVVWAEIPYISEHMPNGRNNTISQAKELVISNFTQWLATHFAGTGIRCNAIAPGFLVSNQNRRLLFSEDGTPTARSAKILNGTPMGRYVESEELLGGVFFLCDDKAASAITGVVLPIDAGFAAYSGV